MFHHRQCGEKDWVAPYGVMAEKTLLGEEMNKVTKKGFLQGFFPKNLRFVYANGTDLVNCFVEKLLAS